MKKIKEYQARSYYFHICVQEIVCHDIMTLFIGKKLISTD